MLNDLDRILIREDMFETLNRIVSYNLHCSTSSDNDSADKLTDIVVEAAKEMKRVAEYLLIYVDKMEALRKLYSDPDTPSKKTTHRLKRRSHEYLHYRR